jgi:hypothetical protein
VIRSNQVVHQLPRPKGVNFETATSIIRTVCEVAGDKDLIKRAAAALAKAGVTRAIKRHDDHVIFGWLVEAVSYQGVSDAAAAGYMHRHGAASAAVIERDLMGNPRCYKLANYWTFVGCGYRKTARTCNNQKWILVCKLPHLDLRNGSLNRAAYGTFLFMRDVCRSDFVSWIDRRLAEASEEERSDGRCLIEPLSHIHGVSSKVLNMALAAMLLGGDINRPLWREVGGKLIAIDTLVHAFLHRTGILRGAGADHNYGPPCYAPGNCADLIRKLSGAIDAREFNPNYPRDFPRFIQHAVWRFCAQQQVDQCNGNKIRAGTKCKQYDCILSDDCARLKLGRATPLATI